MTGRWQNSTRQARLPAAWPTTRRRILRRDAGICHVCGKPGAGEVDHINPGDDHSDGNLGAIHKTPCHAEKSAREGAAAARAARAARPARTRPRESHPGLLPATDEEVTR